MYNTHTNFTSVFSLHNSCNVSTKTCTADPRVQHYLKCQDHLILKTPQHTLQHAACVQRASTRDRLAAASSNTAGVAWWTRVINLLVAAAASSLTTGLHATGQQIRNMTPSTANGCKIHLGNPINGAPKFLYLLLNLTLTIALTLLPLPTLLLSTVFNMVQESGTVVYSIAHLCAAYVCACVHPKGWMDEVSK